eukprot:m.9255 g.9255  ORF g.9255 m.9255 type:complete len:289 (+) comp7154_c0_seq1:89-955(+)
MSGLYPTLEDIQVDEMAKTQVQAQAAQRAIRDALPTESAHLYQDLGLEDLMTTYAGLDLSEGAITQYVPHDIAQAIQSNQRIVALTSDHDKGMMAAQIKQGVRQVVLAKDELGKLGVAVADIDKGVFISFVWTGSAAALGGLRFGDQILQINGETIAGWKKAKVISYLKKADGARITFAVRDRPFDRTLTVVKDSHNQVGFVFKKGEITHIVKDSSAARNGLLIHHNIVEVNGQNVVALPDRDILKIIQEAPPSVTLTIMPSFLFKHIVKGIGFDKMKTYMDRSMPEM